MKTNQEANQENIIPPRCDYDKVGSFLKSVDGATYTYLQLCMNIRDFIKKVIDNSPLSVEDFCKKMGIDEPNYSDYILGNYEYSLEDIAKIQSAFDELNKSDCDKCSYYLTEEQGHRVIKCSKCGDVQPI